MITSDVHSAHLPDTPAGPVTVWVSRQGVRRVEFGDLPTDAHVESPESRPPMLTRAVEQLREYFAGTRHTFDVPIDLEATTDFQRDVYRELVKVPHGRLITYGELAEAVGRPELARAVGQAVGSNPVPILIPCHRVIAADHRLGGFGGGLRAKVALLAVENVHADGTTETSRVHPEVLRLDL
ncbi:MAG TPA: methylated-DNA--[protein]-cysteine S-methyltransferase [Longimicrobiales bacterium]|nr:methylated-DNA--[protein]-cysteine S-methyltransferase [Longimicrobiales bacterium]